MIQKRTWILLLIFLLISIFAVFIEKTPSLTTSFRTPSPTVFLKLFPGWSIDDIASLELSDEKTEVVVGINLMGENSWGFSKPQGIEIDQGKVQSLLSSLVSLEVGNTLDGTSTLEQFGLLKPKWIITLQNTQGEKLLMKIGDETTTASGYYVQLGDTPPVVISKYGIEEILQLFSPEELVLQTPTLPPAAETPTSP